MPTYRVHVRYRFVDEVTVMAESLHEAESIALEQYLPEEEPEVIESYKVGEKE